ncbi:MAG: flagellar hook-basal body complex protein [Herbinix sp.]|nr:flagellar hook-basal body complex protein [Herbinix sp.]
MMRSLYSGVTGLKASQTKMDVIGNNIANVNTIGFKASSVTFSDVLYQTTQSASGPNPTTGTTGTNAMQIGLGSGVASITTSMTTSGAAERTDNPFDVMIEGDSFFIVNSGGTNYFTKAGSFNVASQGTLCTSAGASVMGWQVDENDATKTAAGLVSPLVITSPENMYSKPEATSSVYISGNIDSKDTQLTSVSGKIVNISFYDNIGNSYIADLKITQSTEANNIYNVAVTDIKDDDGQSIFITKSIDEATGNPVYAGSSITEFTFGGVTYSVSDISETDGTFTIDTADSPKITFNGATGAFVSVGDSSSTDTGNKSISLVVNATPNPFSEIDVDFSSITMYSASGSSSLEATKGSLEGTGTGKQVGFMTGVNIDTSGKIYGKYDNGDSKLLGQIAVASFTNPAGLESVGNSMFAATQNSGEFDGIGQDPTQGGGSLSTGVLEMSNVDLAQQFTEMITTQRGFQANSRILSTCDTMLEELINLKR